MGVVIAVANQKGGVGKTLTVSATAAILHEQGYKVLCLDLDPQRNLDMVAGPGVAIPRGNTDQMSILDVLNGKVSIEEIIVQTPLGDLGRASNLLTNWTGEKIITHEEFTELRGQPDALIALLDQRLRNSTEDSQSVRVLERAITEVKEKYDYILIDTNPSLTLLTLNSLYAADYVLVPAFAEESSKQAIGELWETIRGICFYNPHKYLQIAGILITRYSPNTIIARRFCKQYGRIAQKLETVLFETCISQTITASECVERKMNLIEYDAKGKATKDYRAFVEELKKRISEMEMKRNG